MIFAIWSLAALAIGVWPLWLLRCSSCSFVQPSAAPLLGSSDPQLLRSPNVPFFGPSATPPSACGRSDASSALGLFCFGSACMNVHCLLVCLIVCMLSSTIACLCACCCACCCACMLCMLLTCCRACRCACRCECYCACYCACLCGCCCACCCAYLRECCAALSLCRSVALLPLYPFRWTERSRSAARLSHSVLHTATRAQSSRRSATAR